MRLDRPIVFIDLEATGLNPKEARIVEIALLKRSPDGSESSLTALVNPGMPIPPDSQAVHHISDEAVEGEPDFKELAPRIVQFLGDADLCGFGIIRFDVPLLEAELARAGFDLMLKSRRVVDSLVIYHRMEPRNLAAAHRFYCGRPMPVAHRALPDAEAAASVFWAQLDHYQELPRTVGDLDFFCHEREAARLDSEGRFLLRAGKVHFKNDQKGGRPPFGRP